jgi:hypothetical protein
MSVMIRRLFALVSLVGVAASLYVYGASFFGLILDSSKSQLWFFALHLFIFVLYAPICILESQAMRERTFWKKFKLGKPTWVIRGINLAGVLFFVHFVLFFALSHAASPKIIDGAFVLSDHGTIKKVLTQAQYFRIKAAELRIFPTGWLSFYSVCAAYWWFPRNPESVEPRR